MKNLITGLIFSVIISPSNLSDTCKDFYPNHPVRSDIMMQIVLKSYGYYEGKIDGLFGKTSRNSLILFQLNNQLEPDGVIGTKTCTFLLNKANIKKNTKSKTLEVKNTINSFSQEIYDAQLILKDLGLYSYDVDGINGKGTKKALKEFQSKSGLVVDGVLGSKTKAALSKGEDSYVISNNNSNNSDSSSINNEVINYGSDLSNYDPSKPCIEGYVDSNSVWVPDPCFKPVIVYRFGKTAQVNSQNELDAYLAERWSLEKEKTFLTIGRVKTQNYTDGINSPVNGLVMPNGSNNKIIIGIKNDNNVRARPQSGPQNADAIF